MGVAKNVPICDEGKLDYWLKKKRNRLSVLPSDHCNAYPATQTHSTLAGCYFAATIPAGRRRRVRTLEIARKEGLSTLG